MATPLVVAGPGARASAGQAGVEDEVKRLVARELHDRVAQTLTGMLVDVENFKGQQVEWTEVLQQLEMIQSSTRQVLTSIRQLLHDLRGEEFLKGGLVESLRSLVSRFQEKSGIVAELVVGAGWPEVLTAPASLNLYRIVEEALANVRMHSGARQVRIVLEPRPDEQLALIVDDDGRGLDTDALRPVGLGTVGMKERALFHGGHLAVYSGPGAGTTVQAIFPLALLVPAGSTPNPQLMITKGVTA